MVQPQNGRGTSDRRRNAALDDYGPRGRTSRLDAAWHRLRQHRLRPRRSRGAARGWSLCAKLDMEVVAVPDVVAEYAPSAHGDPDGKDSAPAAGSESEVPSLCEAA